MNLLMGIIRLLGSICSGHFLDKVGRKVLLMIGTTCTAIGLLALAISLQLDWTISAEAMVLLLSAGGSIGFGLINPVYFAEVLPAKGNNLMLIFDNIVNLTVNFAFPILASHPKLGVSGPLYGMGVIAVIGLIGIQFKVVETKGLTMYEIYEKFVTMRKQERLEEKMDEEERKPMLENEVT